MEFLSDVLGWIGTVLIVTAFFLVSHGRISPSSRNYQIMNLAGALTLGVNVFYNRAWPAVALQVIWGAIALMALFKSLSRQ